MSHVVKMVLKEVFSAFFITFTNKIGCILVKKSPLLKGAQIKTGD